MPCDRRFSAVVTTSDAKEEYKRRGGNSIVALSLHTLSRTAGRGWDQCVSCFLGEYVSLHESNLVFHSFACLNTDGEKHSQRCPF